MTGPLGGQLFDDVRDRADPNDGRSSAIKPQIKGDLIVARPARVQRGSGGIDLRQTALDRGVDVLVAVEKLERPVIELSLHLPKTPLDGAQLRGLEDPCRGEAARVRDAAGDVERVQLEVDAERRREALQLGQQLPAEAPTPQLFLAYGASLFTSPSRLPSSRSGSRPCT